MKRNRELELIGISHDEYMEMIYFCRQYKNKKEKLNSLTYINGIHYNGFPSGETKYKPTEDTAIELALIKRDIELIEQAAIEADGAIYKELIKNVTENIPYEFLTPACGRRYFYETRIRFFNILYKNKKNG